MVSRNQALRPPSTHTRVESKRLRVAYIGYPDDKEEWPIDADAPQRRRVARPQDQQPSYCFQRLRARPFWEPMEAGIAIAALCGSLEARYEEILNELRPLLAPLLDEDDDGDEDAGTRWTPQGESLHRGVWLRAELWARGVRDDALCQRLSTLSRILGESDAVMRDPPGRVYLSLMTAGTTVKPHCGPTNHRLRVHLPLLLPQGLPLGIDVGTERRLWQLGRCLLLDDVSAQTLTNHTVCYLAHSALFRLRLIQTVCSAFNICARSRLSMP